MHSGNLIFAGHQVQIATFMKNTLMLGAAFLIAWFGDGPVSFEHSRRFFGECRTLAHNRYPFADSFLPASYLIKMR